jgi:hypothetical protein
MRWQLVAWWAGLFGINATVDADGLERLKQMLDKYAEISKLVQ